MLIHWLSLPFFAGKNLSIDFSHLCLVGVIGAGLATLAFRQQKEKIISAWKKEKQQILVWALGCLGFLIITAMLLNFLAVLVSGTPAKKPLNQQMLEGQQTGDSSFWALIKAGFGIVIWAPLLEELIFRWLLFEAFGNNYLSVFLSSLAFGLAHYHGEASPAGIIVFLIYPIMGLAFAYTYRRKKNLIWPIACHSLNNLVAFTFILVSLLK